MFVLDESSQCIGGICSSADVIPTVYIVGAGAGDKSHLTLAAAEAISSADVIFADDLVDSSILALIPGHVELRRVGKRAGQVSAAQDQIIADLIAAGKTRQRVVRLKGGDPFIFGRGGEEASALRDAGFDVVVVPGVTAALIAAASTCIPLTDRRLAQQVTFVTGTDSANNVPSLKGLAGHGRTLVIYMGSRQAGKITKQLLDDGVPTHFPVAIVDDAGRASQGIIVTTVEKLTDATAGRDGTRPAIIIVGEVVTLSPHAQSQSYAEVRFAHG